jgi:hypothetical protein
VLLLLLLVSSQPLLAGAQFGGTQNAIIPRMENSSVPVASKKTYKKFFKKLFQVVPYPMLWGYALVLMRILIRIQHFRSMRIRIQAVDIKLKKFYR